MSFDSIIQWVAGIGTGKIALFAVSFALVGAVSPALIEPYRVQIVHDTVRSSSLPAAFDGARVVFLADIHAGPYFGDGRMADLVERVNDLDADIIVLGGDYVGGRMHGDRIFYRSVGEMRARLGRFAVLGNHDVWEGADLAREGLAAAGFTLLENSSAQVIDAGDSIRIAGLEDLETGRPDATQAADGIAEDDFAILLSHNPAALTSGLAETPGVFDFALAGHTHGGQINVLNSIAPLLGSHYRGRHLNGWRDYGDTPVLVTNGVGTVTAPARAGAKPQIHVITLRAD